MSCIVMLMHAKEKILLLAAGGTAAICEREPAGDAGRVHEPHKAWAMRCPRVFERRLLLWSSTRATICEKSWLQGPRLQPWISAARTKPQSKVSVMRGDRLREPIGQAGRAVDEQAAGLCMHGFRAHRVCRRSLKKPRNETPAEIEASLDIAVRDAASGAEQPPGRGPRRNRRNQGRKTRERD